MGSWGRRHRGTDVGTAERRGINEGPSLGLPLAVWGAKAVSDGSCALVLGGAYEDEDGEWMTSTARKCREWTWGDYCVVMSPHCVEAPSMLSPRSQRFAAAWIESGGVVVAGGVGRDGYEAAVEVLEDGKWGAWSLPSLNLNEPRKTELTRERRERHTRREMSFERRPRYRRRYTERDARSNERDRARGRWRKSRDGYSEVVRERARGATRASKRASRTRGS